ncbi:Panacea domain-containing protein [Flavobacterium sp. C4GT6]|uniref:Panacea domain-containing protein n=1 Tax=Flavobacterium sp. C4GT6 TaxID=3103818 RepID=UPI002ED2BBBD
MTYNCFDIADFFTKLAKEEGQGIDPMKLLKLTYIAHGWYLGITGKPLFHNQIQAWKYGSVIPDLYFPIKIFGKNNVDPYIFKLYTKNKLSKEDKDFLKKIWNNYKDFSGLQLSALTHEEGSPWSQVWDGNHNAIIENSIIKDYYEHKLND